MDNRERFVQLIKSLGPTQKDQAKRVNRTVRTVQRWMKDPPQDVVQLADAGLIVFTFPTTDTTAPASQQ